MDGHRLARIIFSGINDIEEWRLGDPDLAAAKGYPREYPAEPIDDYGIIFADLAIDRADGTLVCHEVNGPNAVGSDALTGDSFLRAQNEAWQAVRRARELGYLLPDGRLRVPVATIHAHQHWRFFRTGGEFYPRVDQFAAILKDLLPGRSVRCFAAGDALSDEDVAVAMGDVPAIASNISIDAATGGLVYLGRPVIFMGNPNLVTELRRLGKLGKDDDNPKLRILHAWRLLRAIRDKGLQQQLLAGTGIRPLRHFAAASAADALRHTREMLAHGPAVLKPSATSGGCGVTAVVPGMSDAEIAAAIETLVGECRQKYGENAEATIFPIGGFEFVRAAGYPMADGEHLWDLRIAVLFEPGRAQAFPVSLRFAPKPFDPRTFHLDRDQWISNVSGRRDTFLKSGMDDAVLAKIGFTDAMLDQAMQGCVGWAIKAWDQSIRGGGQDGSVYEDLCEDADQSFYDWEKFST